MGRESGVIVGLHHVSLLVTDTRRSLAFYVGVLGLEPDPDRPGLGFPGAWLHLGDGRQIHLLELPNPDPITGRPAHGGRDRHLALWVRDIPTITTRLEHAHIPFTRSQSGREAIFCRDPDGNSIELVLAPFAG
ncbi:MAG: VOC family protein [Gammaproteobacteria bacterium]|nr:VOC family protein [Gammaproteobacteria bacterium]MBU1654268.1 VOC family protein [Gammaproteobacteria bacterium]MBU1960649.1 VOC family protein [Gammaproteobacteria bacterium]